MTKRPVRAVSGIIDGMVDKARDRPHHTRIFDRGFEVAETIIYAGIALLLSVTAVALLILAGSKTVKLFGDDSASPALEVLDTLLLVFIVVELLFAVRATVVKRELVAEPFLIVGIIVAIKEIVVLSVKASKTAGEGRIFRDQLLEIGTLGVLILLLGLTAFLLRRKEREPDEA